MKTDSEIQKDVLEELKWQPFLNAGEIGVSVKNGVVALSGSVDAYSKKVAAENAAKNVAGVKAVAENIQVRLGFESRKNDAEIAEAVLNALQWHSAMQDNKIKVKVENGWVTLEGQVDWEFQRDSARSMVENLTGVIGISNNITIKALVESGDIKRKIASAFHRSATIDSNHIAVGVNGSTVTLTGKVRSYTEKRDAEKAAWLAPGVIKIDNKLEIDTEIYA